MFRIRIAPSLSLWPRAPLPSLLELLAPRVLAPQDPAVPLLRCLRLMVCAKPWSLHPCVRGWRRGF